MKTLCWGVGSALLVLIAGAAQPAFAVPLFSNPGFETGDFTGWTVNYVAAPDWGSTKVWDGTLEGLAPNATGGGTGLEDAVVVPMGWGIDPYTGTGFVSKVLTGNYSARIGDANNQIFHNDKTRDDDPFSVSLSQTATLNEPLNAIVVSWAAAVVEPANWEDHQGPGYPSFRLLVTNETTGEILYNVSHHSHEKGAYWEQGVPQLDPGVTDLNNLEGQTHDPSTVGQWWYQPWIDEYIDIRDVPVGHEISIMLSVQDCGLRGHPAHARLDIDYDYRTNGPVPEPATVLLLAGGLAAAAWRLRRRVA